MNLYLRAAALAAAASSLAACATVTRGSNTAWEVQTTPSGASVKTSHGMVCDSTPCSLRMPRKSEFTATISKPGYKTVGVKVTHKVAGGGAAGMAGNVLVGGIIGAGVDVASGAMLDLTPNPAVVVMERDDVPVTPVATAPGVPSRPADAPATTAPPAPAGK